MIPSDTRGKVVNELVDQITRDLSAKAKGVDEKDLPVPEHIHRLVQDAEVDVYNTSTTPAQYFQQCASAADALKLELFHKWQAGGTDEDKGSPMASRGSAAPPTMPQQAQAPVQPPATQLPGAYVLGSGGPQLVLLPPGLAAGALGNVAAGGGQPVGSLQLVGPPLLYRPPKEGSSPDTGDDVSSPAPAPATATMPRSSGPQPGRPLQRGLLLRPVDPPTSITAMAAAATAGMGGLSLFPDSTQADMQQQQQQVLHHVAPQQGYEYLPPGTTGSIQLPSEVPAASVPLEARPATVGVQPAYAPGLSMLAGGSQPESKGRRAGRSRVPAPSGAAAVQGLGAGQVQVSAPGQQVSSSQPVATTGQAGRATAAAAGASLLATNALGGGVVAITVPVQSSAPAAAEGPVTRRAAARKAAAGSVPGPDPSEPPNSSGSGTQSQEQQQQQHQQVLIDSAAVGAVVASVTKAAAAAARLSRSLPSVQQDSKPSSSSHHPPQSITPKLASGGEVVSAQESMQVPPDLHSWQAHGLPQGQGLPVVPEEGSEPWGGGLQVQGVGGANISTGRVPPFPPSPFQMPPGLLAPFPGAGDVVMAPPSRSQSLPAAGLSTATTRRGSRQRSRAAQAPMLGGASADHSMLGVSTRSGRTTRKPPPSFMLESSAPYEQVPCIVSGPAALEGSALGGLGGLGGAPWSMTGRPRPGVAGMMGSFLLSPTPPPPPGPVLVPTRGGQLVDSLGRLHPATSASHLEALQGTGATGDSGCASNAPPQGAGAGEDPTSPTAAALPTSRLSRCGTMDSHTLAPNEGLPLQGSSTDQQQQPQVPPLLLSPREVELMSCVGDGSAQVPDTWQQQQQPPQVPEHLQQVPGMQWEGTAERPLSFGQEGDLFAGAFTGGLSGSELLLPEIEHMLVSDEELVQARQQGAGMPLPAHPQGPASQGPGLVSATDLVQGPPLLPAIRPHIPQAGVQLAVQLPTSFGEGDDDEGGTGVPPAAEMTVGQALLTTPRGTPLQGGKRRTRRHSSLDAWSTPSSEDIPLSRHDGSALPVGGLLLGEEAGEGGHSGGGFVRTSLPYPPLPAIEEAAAGAGGGSSPRWAEAVTAAANAEAAQLAALLVDDRDWAEEGSQLHLLPSLAPAPIMPGALLQHSWQEQYQQQPSSRPASAPVVADPAALGPLPAADSSQGRDPAIILSSWPNDPVMRPHSDSRPLREGGDILPEQQRWGNSSASWGRQASAPLDASEAWHPGAAPVGLQQQQQPLQPPIQWRMAAAQAASTGPLQGLDLPMALEAVPLHHQQPPSPSAPPPGDAPQQRQRQQSAQAPATARTSRRAAAAAHRPEGGGGDLSLMMPAPPRQRLRVRPLPVGARGPPTGDHPAVPPGSPSAAGGRVRSQPLTSAPPYMMPPSYHPLSRSQSMASEGAGNYSGPGQYSGTDCGPTPYMTAPAQHWAAAGGLPSSSSSLRHSPALGRAPSASGALSGVGRGPPMMGLMGHGTGMAGGGGGADVPPMLLLLLPQGGAGAGGEPGSPWSLSGERPSSSSGLRPSQQQPHHPHHQRRSSKLLRISLGPTQSMSGSAASDLPSPHITAGGAGGTLPSPRGTGPAPLSSLLLQQQVGSQPEGGRTQSVIRLPQQQGMVPGVGGSQQLMAVSAMMPPHQQEQQQQQQRPRTIRRTHSDAQRRMYAPGVLMHHPAPASSGAVSHMLGEGMDLDAGHGDLAGPVPAAGHTLFATSSSDVPGWQGEFPALESVGDAFPQFSYGMPAATYAGGHQGQVPLVQHPAAAGALAGAMPEPRRGHHPAVYHASLQLPISHSSGSGSLLSSQITPHTSSHAATAAAASTQQSSGERQRHTGTSLSVSVSGQHHQQQPAGSSAYGPTSSLVAALAQATLQQPETSTAPSPPSPSAGS